MKEEIKYIKDDGTLQILRYSINDLIIKFGFEILYYKNEWRLIVDDGSELLVKFNENGPIIILDKINYKNNISYIKKVTKLDLKEN